jgi:uncharacterized protein YxjI
MRNRREDRRENRRDSPGAGGPGPAGGGGVQHYQMRQKMLSIGDDFWVENDRGEKVFKVDGKALRVRKTLVLEDRNGTELFKIQERMLTIKDSMEIEDAGGNRVAMVKKAMITPLRERWSVDIPGGKDLEVQGNIVDHEYRIGNVAEVSKKWFRIADSYGIEVAPGQNDALIIAVAVIIDTMSHPAR